MILENIAVKAIITKEKSILLLKNNPNIKQENDIKKREAVWDLPGGRVEKNEKLKETLLREIKEEINIDVEIIKQMSEWNFIGRDGNKIKVYNFLCKPKNINSLNNIKISKEHIDFKFVNLKDLKNYKVKDNSFYKAIKDVFK